MRKIINYDDDRFRSWTIILYSDSKSYDFDSVFQIIKSYKFYAYIKHQPDNDIKKVHYHVNLFLDNPTTRHALSKKLGVPENFIESISNVRVMNRYLTHIDFPERIQYSINDVFVSSSYFKKFKKCYDDLETESEIIDKIFSKIDDLISQFSYFDCTKILLKWCSDNCYESIFKKYYVLFLDYLKGKL